MLIDFEVANFRSFKGPALLSMLAAKPIKENQDDNVFGAGIRNLLKSAVVYGANASGKSNLLHAMLLMRWLVLNSSKESTSRDPIDAVPFAFDVDCQTAPSRFQVRFQKGDTCYRYGFEADKTRVQAEWLFKSGKTARETNLFLRFKDEIKVGGGFAEGRGFETKTRHNSLFLSVVAQFDGKIANEVFDWFFNLCPIHGLGDGMYSYRSLEMLMDVNARQRLVAFMRAADVGIEDLRVVEEAVDPSTVKLLENSGYPIKKDENGDVRLLNVKSQHAVYSGSKRVGSGEIGFDNESEGTKKLFNLAGMLIDCLDRGSVLIVDEIDAKLHPILTSAVVGLFNSKQTNPRGAQIILATHDIQLLTSAGFRRDQVWFVEKGFEGATRLYSLAEIKLPVGGKVRNDTALQKSYMAGRFGAVPYLSDFKAEVWGAVDGKTH